MKNPELVKQIQYYLSPDNLKNDEFFFKEVTSNPEHYVKLDCFIKCNKIKKLGVTKAEQIVEALSQSKNLQLNQKKNMLRLVDLKVPEFNPQKKNKSEDKKVTQNPYDKVEVYFVPYNSNVFVLSIEKQEKVPFRYIQETLLKNYNIYSPYVRFNKTEGHFTINKKHDHNNEIKELTEKGFKVGEVVLNVTKCEGAALDKFWEQHGHHFNGIIQNLRKDFNKRQKQQKRNIAKNRTYNFSFGGQVYTDINKLKSLFKNILCRNPNNTPLKQSQHNLVKELLGFHHNSQDKLKNLKHFVVDVHPSYVDTRCLFAVKEDGSRQDFSIVKCIHAIEDKEGK